MDYLILIIGVVLFLIACVLDINSSTEMTKWGIKEKNSFVADGKGNFSLWKGLIFTIAPVAVVIIVFFVWPKEESSGWDRVYAGFFLMPGAVLHYWASRRNWKLIEKKKAGGFVA